MFIATSLNRTSRCGSGGLVERDVAEQRTLPQAEFLVQHALQEGAGRDEPLHQHLRLAGPDLPDGQLDGAGIVAALDDLRVEAGEAELAR